MLIISPYATREAANHKAEALRRLGYTAKVERDPNGIITPVWQVRAENTAMNHPAWERVA